jgi:hypothetical protein
MNEIGRVNTQEECEAWADGKTPEQIRAEIARGKAEFERYIRDVQADLAQQRRRPACPVVQFPAKLAEAGEYRMSMVRAQGRRT